MPKQYRVKLSEEKIIGPFSVVQILELYKRNHISGKEQFQEYPDGTWFLIGDYDAPELSKIFINDSSGIFDELEKLEHDRKKDLNKEFKFDIDDSIHNVDIVDHEKLLREYDEEKIKKSILDSFKNKKGVIKKSETKKHVAIKLQTVTEFEKTRINPIVETARPVESENVKVEVEVSAPVSSEVVSIDNTVDRFEKTEQVNLSEHLPVLQKKVEHYEQKILDQAIKDQKKKKEEKSKKRNFLVMASLILLVTYFYFQLEEKDEIKKPLYAKISYPIIKEIENEEIAKVAYEKGDKLYANGRYFDKLQAAVFFKQSYENKKHVEEISEGKTQYLLSKALSSLILTYAEIFDNVENDKFVNKNKGTIGKVDSSRARAGTVLYQLIELAKGKTLTDVRAALGKAIFYIKLKKYSTAHTVLESFSMLAKDSTAYQSNDLMYKFFAYYLQVLVELNLEQEEKAKNIFNKIYPTSQGVKKPEEVYVATYKYLTAVGKEKEANEELVKAATLYKDRVGPLLRYAHFLVEQKDMQNTEKILEIVQLLQFERSPVYYSEFIEIVGTKLAIDKKMKSAALKFNEALKIHNSDRLRAKISNFELGGKDVVDRLILQSKVYRIVEKSQRFKRRLKYREALYAAIEAVDLLPDSVLANLQLADIQITRGFYKAAVAQLEGIKDNGWFKIQIMSKLIRAYVGAMMLKEADTIVRESPMWDEADFHSACAKYYEALGKKYLHMMIKELNSSIDLNPLSDEDYFSLAKIYYDQNMFKQSMWMLQKSMNLDPSNIAYHSLYAKILYELQGIKVAAGYVRDLLQQYPDEPKLLADLAMYYYRDQQMDNFKELKNKIELSEIKDISFYEFMVGISKREGLVDDVITYSNGYILVNPGNVNIRMDLATYLFLNKKYEKALVELDAVTERIMTYPDVHALISKIYTIVTITPAIVSGTVKRYLIAVKPDVIASAKKSIEDYKEQLVTIVSPQDKQSHDLLLKEVFGVELDSALKKIVDHGINDFFKNTFAKILIKGKISKELYGDEKYLNEFVDSLLGMIFVNAEISDLALLEAKYEVYHNPKSFEGYYALGSVYLKMSDYKNAVANFEKAISNNLDHTDSLVALASIRYREGFHDVAKELYEKALKLDPSRFMIYKELGKLYQEMGQSVLAIEFYENYLTLDPTTPEKAQIQEMIKQLK